MTEPRDERGLISLPAPGSRVVVRYLISTGQATDALGELLSIEDQTVVVNGVRGVERIAVADIVAAKEVPPRRPPLPHRSRGEGRSTHITHRVSVSSTEGFTVSQPSQSSSPDGGDSAKEDAVPELEVDQTIAPRPEEEIADVLNEEPDSGVSQEDEV